MTPRRRILPIFIPHAGCPNDCVFCNQKRISGSLFPASAQTVRDALAPLPADAGLELAFYGGSFTALPVSAQEELLAAAEPYRKCGTVSSLRVSTRPDAVDGERLECLRRYGVETVELGAQSMCDVVLCASGRGHTAGDTERAVDLLREYGFAVILQMMTGLPGSSPERDMETARRIIALHPDGVRIYPTVIVRDTPLEEMWKRGAYREHTVEDAVTICARIVPLMEAAGITVIRLGLNPTEELSGGAVLGGAYHPALGELVLSRIWRERAESLVVDIMPNSDVVLAVPENRVSVMTGQHRCNVDYLCAKFGLHSLKIVGDPGQNEGIALKEWRLQNKAPSVII